MATHNTPLNNQNISFSSLPSLSISLSPSPSSLNPSKVNSYKGKYGKNSLSPISPLNSLSFENLNEKSYVDDVISAQSPSKSNEALSFSIIHEKHLSNPLKIIQFCPLMDLLAYVSLSISASSLTVPDTDSLCVSFSDSNSIPSNNQTLTISRINWQTVSESNIIDNITSISWQPQGQLIAIGDVKGKLFIYSIEEKRILYTFHYHSFPIINMTWLQYPLTPYPLSPISLMTSFSSPSLHILSSIDTSGQIHFNLGNILHLCSISLPSLLSPSLSSLFPLSIPPSLFFSSIQSPTLSLFQLSPSLSSLSLIISSDSKIDIISIDTSIYKTFAIEFHQSIQSDFSSLSSLILDQERGIGSQWVKDTTFFRKRINLFRNLLSDYLDSHPSLNISSFDQYLIDAWMLLITCGISPSISSLSSVLLEYLSGYCDPNQIIKMKEAINNGIENLIEIINIDIIKTLENTISSLSSLRQLSHSLSIEKIGLITEQISLTIDLVDAIYLKAHHLLSLISEVQNNILAFLKYLYYLSFQYSDNITGEMEYDQDYDFDFEKIINFIQKDLLYDRILAFFKESDLDLHIISSFSLLPSLSSHTIDAFVPHYSLSHSLFLVLEQYQILCSEYGTHLKNNLFLSHHISLPYSLVFCDYYSNDKNNEYFLLAYQDKKISASVSFLILSLPSNQYNIFSITDLYHLYSLHFYQNRQIILVYINNQQSVSLSLFDSPLNFYSSLLIAKENIEYLPIIKTRKLPLYPSYYSILCRYRGLLLLFEGPKKIIILDLEEDEE